MKKVKYLVIGFIAFVCFSGEVLATSSISMSKSAGSITAGNSVTVTLTISANNPLFSIEGTMSCSGAGVNASQILNWDDTSNKISSKSYSVWVTPNQAGTITCSANAKVLDMSSIDWQSLNTQTSISVAAKPVYNNPVTPNNGGSAGTVTPKSSVNYLKSLEVEGKTLSPNFDKETSEYTVELESGTTSINIKATAQDNKANISGAGVVNVTEGINTIKIVVTAENGSKRTYTIKANVKEKDPIIVTIDGKNYTVVRKSEQLPQASALYTPSTIKMNDEDIPVYIGDVTGYTLVGLKDSEGNISLFTYDEENKKYNLYREFNFSPIVFFPLTPDDKDIPYGYKKSTIKINDVELTCYKMSEDDKFVLLYGVNIENNNEGFYIYDAFEHTLQRYNDAIFDTVNNELVILRSIIIGLGAIIIVVVFASAIQGTENKFMNRTRKMNTKEKEPKTKDKKKKAKATEEVTEEIENKKSAKLLEKDLKRKEKEKKIKKKHKKDFLENTNVIDITDINIKK